VLVVMGWSTMRHRLRTVGDPVSDDREHRVATHFHFATSSFVITVFNPLTVMAFVAAFAGRDLAGVGSSLPDAATLVAGVFAGACAWWAILCTASVWLRQHFTGKGLLYLNRAAGAVILAFGVVALVSLLPLPWRQIAKSLDL
jgi:threonine/homoserine/homoserine lactone efflux protein